MPETVSSAADGLAAATEKAATLWDNFVDWFFAVGPKILWAAIIFAVGWWLSGLIIKIMRKGLSKTEIEKSVVTFLCSISKYALRLIVIILCFIPFGFQVGSLFAALGAAGITLGLGLKESVSNLASGVQIIVTKPFGVGDYIQLDQVEGTVLRVEMMFTTMKTLDCKEVVIPNSKITLSILTNYTSLGVRRVDFNYSVRYGTNIAELREAMLQMATEEEMVLKDPAPLFAILNQGVNGIDVTMRLYCVPENYWSLYFSMHEKVKILFEELEVQIPFNQMDIHIRQDDTVAPEHGEKHTVQEAIKTAIQKQKAGAAAESCPQKAAVSPPEKPVEKKTEEPPTSPPEK